MTLEIIMEYCLFFMDNMEKNFSELYGWAFMLVLCIARNFATQQTLSIRRSNGLFPFEFVWTACKTLHHKHHTIALSFIVRTAKHIISNSIKPQLQ